MRKLTILLAIVLALLLGFAGWFYLGGTLRSEVAVQSARAADYPEAFGAIRSLVTGGAAPQVRDAHQPGAVPGGVAAHHRGGRAWGHRSICHHRRGQRRRPPGQRHHQPEAGHHRRRGRPPAHRDTVLRPWHEARNHRSVTRFFYPKPLN